MLHRVSVWFKTICPFRPTKTLTNTSFLGGYLDVEKHVKSSSQTESEREASAPPCGLASPANT